MASTPDEIVDAALKLSEADRLLIANRLLETLPDDLPGLSCEDAVLLDELERRAGDSAPTIPASELWKRA
ncbi:MAG: hypothetical protein AB7U73_01770 [Pirellulales bacterium]